MGFSQCTEKRKTQVAYDAKGCEITPLSLAKLCHHYFHKSMCLFECPNNRYSNQSKAKSIICHGVLYYTAFGKTDLPNSLCHISPLSNLLIITEKK